MLFQGSLEAVMKSSVCVSDRSRNASFRIVLSLVTIVPLWLMLVAADTSADAQTTSSPADWTEFHRDNMQRWNPYETVLGVNNVGSLKLKMEESRRPVPIIFILARSGEWRGLYRLGRR
jgi:hypothetical protein